VDFYAEQQREESGKKKALPQKGFSNIWLKIIP